MSEIRYFTDGEQATAAVLNRPLEDLEKKSQYIGEADMLSAQKALLDNSAGAGLIKRADVTHGADYFFNGINTGISNYSNTDSAYYYEDAFQFNTKGWTGTTDNQEMIMNVNGHRIVVDGTSISTSSNIHNIIPTAPAPGLTVTNINEVPMGLEAGDFFYYNGRPELHPNTSFDTGIDGYDASGRVNISWDADNNRLKIEIDAENTQGYISYICKTVPGCEYEVTYTVNWDDPSVTSMKSMNHSPATESQTALEPGTYTYRFIANAYESRVHTYVYGVSGSVGYVENISVKPSGETPIFIKANDSIDTNGQEIHGCPEYSIVSGRDVTRRDSIILEAWHEKVSDKDFVYPLGNVQYNGEFRASYNEGTFVGADTYSLFGNWQEPGDFIGRGYKWSELSEEQKRNFASNVDNNIYVSNDEVYQIRYRIRSIKGVGSYTVASESYNVDFGYKHGISYSGVRTKLGATNISGDIFRYQVEGSNYIFRPETIYDSNYNNNVEQPGIYGAGTRSANSYHPDAYKGKGYMVPLFLVEKRNTGAYHPIHNPHGTAGFKSELYDSYAVSWAYQNSTDKALQANSIIDCFDGSFVSSTYSGEPNGSFKAGLHSISDSTRPRPDGLAFNHVDYRDITDLRKWSQKVSPSDLAAKYTQDIVNAKVRSFELKPNVIDSGKKIKVISNTISPDYIAGYNYDNINTVAEHFRFTYEMVEGAQKTSFPSFVQTRRVYNTMIWENETTGYRMIIQTHVAKISQNTFHSSVTSHTYGVIRPTEKIAEFESNFNIGDIIKIYYIDEENSYSYRYNHKGVECDIIGNPNNYPNEWAGGNLPGVPNIFRDDNAFTFAYPDSLISDIAQDNRVFKLNRKSEKVLQVSALCADGTWRNFSNEGGGGDHVALGYNTGADGGVWNRIGLNFDASFETLGYISVEDMASKIVFIIHYQTHALNLKHTSKHIPLAIGKGIAGSEADSYDRKISTLGSHLFGKVTTGGDTQPDYFNTFDVHADITGGAFTDKDYGISKATAQHDTIKLAQDGEIAFKALPFISSMGNKDRSMRLSLLFKEMRWDPATSVSGVNIEALDTTVNPVSVEDGKVYKCEGGNLDGLIVKSSGTGSFNPTDDYLGNNGIIYHATGVPNGYFTLWNGNGWGDNDKFETNSGFYYYTDENNLNTISGFKYIQIPYWNHITDIPDFR